MTVTVEVVPGAAGSVPTLEGARAAAAAVAGQAIGYAVQRAYVPVVVDTVAALRPQDGVRATAAAGADSAPDPTAAVSAMPPSTTAAVGAAVPAIHGAGVAATRAITARRAVVTLRPAVVPSRVITFRRVVRAGAVAMIGRRSGGTSFSVLNGRPGTPTYRRDVVTVVVWAGSTQEGVQAPSVPGACRA